METLDRVSVNPAVVVSEVVYDREGNDWVIR